MARKPYPPGIPIIYQSYEDYEKPHHDKIEPFESVSEVLQWEQYLRRELLGNEKPAAGKRKGTTSADDRLQEIWFRGTREHFPLAPGIYRAEIADLVNNKERDWSFGK